MKNTIIPPFSGVAFRISKSSIFKIIDLEGMQVADLVLIDAANQGNDLSTKTTIDVNQSIRLINGHRFFSNKYVPIATLIKSDVPHHDLLHPACSDEMYRYFYNAEDHPSCRNNLINALKPFNISTIPDPVNIFMNTHIESNGNISVKAPLSTAGSQVEIKAEIDLIVAVAACSVQQSACNGHQCTSLEVVY